MGDPWSKERDGVGLGAWWDLKPLCHFVATVPLQVMRGELPSRVARLHSKQRGMPSILEVSGVNGHLSGSSSASAVRAFFASVGSAEMIVLDGAARTSAAPGPGRPRLERVAPALLRIAIGSSGALGRYACVQWRYEASHAFRRQHTRDLQHCTQRLIATAREAMRQRDLHKAFVVTDLEDGNSMSFNHGAQTTAAYRTLVTALPARHVNLIDRVRQNSGVYAQLQAEVCARAALLVTCEERLAHYGAVVPPAATCKRCVKWKSGFTLHVLQTRLQLQRLHMLHNMTRWQTVAWRRV